MIILRNVIKAYGSGKQALSGVTLTVPNEDFVFLVGGNGAGKSTLLKLLIRQEVATSGVIMVAGHDLKTLPDRRVPAFRQQLGVVFQDIRLFPQQTVEENVAFSLRVAGMDRRVGARDLVAEAMDLVGMSGYARRFPHQLSGGEQQRARLRGQSSGHPRSSSLMNQPQVSHPTFPGRSSNSSVRSIGEE